MRQNKIEQEIAALGIEQSHFETFYEQLKINQQLPPPELQYIVSTEQYRKIVDYLTQKKVLREDGTISEKDLKVFDARKSLEEKLEQTREERSPRVVTSGGGVSPCTYFRASSGGIAPCRFPTGYVQTGYVQTSKDRISPRP